jgi:hypothetical protein
MTALTSSRVVESERKKEEKSNSLSIYFSPPTNNTKNDY